MCINKPSQSSLFSNSKLASLPPAQVCSRQSSTCSPATPTPGRAQGARKCEVPLWAFPAEVEQGDLLPSCLSSPTSNKCLFSLFRATFSALLCLLLEILLFKMAPTCSAEKSSCVAKCKEALMCLMEKYVLDKLHSGMSYTAVGVSSMLINQQIRIK